MPKINLSARFQFWREIYRWSWRWVVFIAWNLPYAGVAFYDFLVGQGYLSEDTPKVSQIIPDWGYYTWIGIGIILFIAFTLEGSYRYFSRIKTDYARDIKRLSERQTGNETTAALATKQERINTELENRRRICESIQNILPKLRDRITLLVSEADASVDDDVLKKALQKVTEYAEQYPNPSGESHDEFLRELRHGLDTYDIGVNSLVQNDRQASALSADLQSRRLELSHPVLNQHIRNYRNVLFDSSSARLLAKYATGGQLQRVANFMRREEDTNERLIRIMVEINRLIATYIMGDGIL